MSYFEEFREVVRGQSIYVLCVCVCVEFFSCNTFVIKNQVFSDFTVSIMFITISLC